MTRNLFGGAVLLATSMLAAPALADINPEYFLPSNGYVAGTAMSANFWDQQDDTAGVLDIVDLGNIFMGEENLATQLTANGADAEFPSVTALALDWGGPGRDNGKLWFTVDIEKGVPQNNTPLGSFIWNLSFNRPSDTNIFSLDGGLGTFRLKTAAGNTASFNLHDGWNQVGVLNDVNANPNTILYLDGVQVAAIQVGSGPLNNAATAVGQVSLTRQGRGGPDDPFVGTMKFDNIITANENILKPIPEPATVVLAGMGLVSIVLLHRRRRLA